MSERFITGKTLKASPSDLEEMYLTAAKVMNAFYGDGVPEQYFSQENEMEENEILPENGQEFSM